MRHQDIIERDREARSCARESAHSQEGAEAQQILLKKYHKMREFIVSLRYKLFTAQTIDKSTDLIVNVASNDLMY